MSQQFWEMLVSGAGAIDVAKTSPALQQRLRRLSEDLAVILGGCDALARDDILARLCAQVLSHIQAADTAAREALATPAEDRQAIDGQPPRPGELSPELLEWARQQFSAEEIVAGLREIRSTGGQELTDFLGEIDKELAPRE
jgi:hypothetical protein